MVLNWEKTGTLTQEVFRDQQTGQAPNSSHKAGQQNDNFICSFQAHLISLALYSNNLF